MKKGMRRLFAAVVIMLAAFLMFSACSGSSQMNKNGAARDFFNTETTEYESAAEQKGNDDTAKGIVAGGRKILKTYKDIITTKDFNKTLQMLESAISECGGYVEMSDIDSGANSPAATFVYRIPADKAKHFKSLVSGAGDLANQSENSEDVTAEYIDTEARLKVLTESRDAITSMLAGAKSVQELLELRERLDQLNMEIERYTTSIKRWDGLIEMSRYTVMVETVGEGQIISKLPYGTQLSDALSGGFSGFIFITGRIIIVIVYILPYLFLALAAFVIAMCVVRFKNRPRK